jgi:hypothetical protein
MPLDENYGAQERYEKQRRAQAERRRKEIEDANRQANAKETIRATGRHHKR